MQKSDIVNTFGLMRKQITDPCATLTVLSKRKRRSHDRLRRIERRRVPGRYLGAGPHRVAGLVHDIGTELRRDLTGVGKKEILRNPIFGPLFSAAGVVFVDRANTAQAIDALEPAVQALREGRSLAIAPEGTRSRTPRLGRFKKGAFHMARQAGVPVVPVVFRNVLDALPRGAAVVRPATVEVVVLPPVDTSKWTVDGLDEEIDAIRTRYLEVLDE